MWPTKQQRNTINLESIGQVVVSTVELHHTWGNGFETCLFWTGNSMVVDNYSDEYDAKVGHIRWTRPENVARAIARLETAQ